MPRATPPHAITEAKLRAAVSDAATAHDAVSRIADEVVADPRIAGALKPVPAFESQTLRGVAIAAGAPLLVALGRLAGVEIAEGDAAIVVSTLVSLIGAAYAWRGRATTTRPLA
ncbi:hypothetical protein ACFSCV_04165 [Methylopila henanensis]|uniref:Uncharacterized protein n=1 Tax=Methylopila henanensis TaxID=873516 RepID=A0ABW4K5J9_9HYPH